MQSTSKNRSRKPGKQPEDSGNGSFDPNPRVGWYQGANAHEGHRGQKREDEVFEIIRTQPIKTETRIKELYLQRLGLTAGKTKAELKVTQDTPAYKKVDDELHNLKERLFGWTPSGFCPDGRDDEGLVDYNGRVLVDFDKLPSVEERERIFQLLIQEKYILKVWRSISGYGVKALACCSLLNKAYHKTNFKAVSDRMFALTGHHIDRACSNSSRFSFVAYDPQLFKRDAKAVEVLRVDEPKDGDTITPPVRPLSEDKLARLQAWIERDGKVGAVEWTTKDGQPVGKCEQCPSGRKHKDGMIFLNGIPYFHCFHPESCKQAVADYNDALRATWTEIFYEDARKQFWIREKADPDRWMTINDTRTKAALRSLGVSRKVCDDWLYLICGWSNVRYAAPLAGYKSDVYQMFNEKILVTRSPKILEPKQSLWPVLRKFLTGLLDKEQLPVLMGWLLIAYEALRSGEPRHGQALALVGPAKAGKSLLQKLITVILGGRVKHPFKYMTGRTDFNAELFEAEHLCIDDEKSSIDIRSRRELGTAIKMVCVNQEQTCFRKYATPVTLIPFWRLTISVNDDPEALQVLPPLDEDIADKLILLKTAKRPMPLPTRSGPERKRFWNQLVGELPGFLYDLTKKWSIPAKLLESEWADRYGIDSFKHPDVVRELTELSPEWRLLELLDLAYFPKTDEAGQTMFYKEPIRGNHRVIEHKLRTVHTNFVIDKLLAGPQTLVKYLGRLAKNPETKRRIKAVHGHSREWELWPPKELPEPRPEDAF